MDVVRPQFSQQVTGIAVQVDERLEAVLFAAVKQPVDRALLVCLAVVFVEVIQEIAAYHLTGRTPAAQSIGDEFQVFFQRFSTVYDFNELDKPPHDVITEVLIVADGKNIVLVGVNVLYFPSSHSPPA